MCFTDHLHFQAVHKLNNQCMGRIKKITSTYFFFNCLSGEKLPVSHSRFFEILSEITVEESNGWEILHPDKSDRLKLL